MLLHHIIAENAVSIEPFAIISDSQVHRSELPTIDDIPFAIFCGNISSEISSQKQTSNPQHTFVVSMSAQDCLHVMLASVAGVEDARGNYLRRAVGVTALSLAVPALHPHSLLPQAVHVAVTGVSVKQMLHFLVDRRIVQVAHVVPSSAASNGSAALDNDDTVTYWRSGDESTSASHLSSDYSCAYLNRFLSEPFVRSGRVVTAWVAEKLSDDGVGESGGVGIHESWRDTKGKRNTSETSFYSGDKLKAVLANTTWIQADTMLKSLFEKVFPKSSLKTPEQVHMLYILMYVRIFM